VRAVFAGGAIFVVAFAAYFGNDETITSFDSAPTTVFAFNVLENHTLAYDTFRSSYFDRIGGGYAFVEAPNGHLTSLFPVGTALLTFPIFSTLYALRSIQAGPPPILAPEFEDERHRDEKLAATIVAACAVVLCYFTARRLGTPFQAGIATFAFGFAGEMWTIGAEGLWQHGPVNLVLLCAVLFVLRAAETRETRCRWLLAGAGLCAGALPAIRPTALLFTLALVVFVLTERPLRSQAPWFGLGFVAGFLPGLAWNAAFFHSLSGGYAADLGTYDFVPAHVLAALAGLLVSPSRGFFVFSPIIVFSIAGLLRASRASARPARLVVLLGAACALLLINYACYGGWIGGHCYGPRFLTDMSAVLALALVYVVPASPSQLRKADGKTKTLALCFAVALLVSTAVQIVGSYSGAAGPVWNAIPVNVAFEPARIWALKDSQIERNVRAMFYRYAPVFPTAGTAYAAGFKGSVLGAADLTAPRAGTVPLVAVRVRNDGKSRWYGYDTAVYNGEARVRATVSTQTGVVISQQELYIAGTVAGGQTVVARGLLALPATPGSYDLAFVPLAFSRSDIPPGNVRSLRTALNVR
jgi:hypothetical protein